MSCYDSSVLASLPAFAQSLAEQPLDAPYLEAEKLLSPENIAFNVYRAAMWLSLGDKTQRSRSGLDVVFRPEYRLNGRADLSGMETTALFQLKHAGIDPSLVTESELAGFMSDLARREGERDIENGRFLITRPFSEPYTGSTGSCGRFVRVKLLGGLGVVIESKRIEVGGLEGVSGAEKEIKLVIEHFKKAHPEYAQCRIDNNNDRHTS